MSLYSDHILPRCIDFALTRPPILELRERVTRDLRGEVLEIGFGSGPNLTYYPEAVTQIFALDPARHAQTMSRRRISARGIPVHWLPLPDSGQIPLPDHSVDSVLSTFTLCTIPRLEGALAELRRVLRPAGKLHFLEHGRSPRRRVAYLQDRLTPLQRRVAGGCHLNRPIDVLLRDAGFCLDALNTFDLPGFGLAAFMFEGVARVCDEAVLRSP